MSRPAVTFFFPSSPEILISSLLVYGFWITFAYL